MSKSKIDNKVLETYSDTILESLQNRIKELKLNELPEVRGKIKEAQLRTSEGGKRVTQIVGLTKEEFKALGIEAKDNAVYRANMMEIEKTKLAQAKATGSKKAEEDAKKNIRDLRSQTFLGRIANDIGDLKKKAAEKV